MKKHFLVMIIYDSVTNPVFESQVVQYIKNKLLSGAYQRAYIISFERNHLTFDHIFEYIEIIYAPRPFFISMFSLHPCTKFLVNFLNSLASYEMVARGAYAGYISLRALLALYHNQVPQLTIQLRGLLTEEYVYSQKKTLINRLIVPLRAYTLRRLERWVYNNQWIEHYGVQFEGVSSAMNNYISTAYALDTLCLAQHDLINPISPKHLSAWRLKIRDELTIPQEAYVYCYNGSAKPWQCVEKTLEYFAQQQKECAHQWLLIISSQPDSFSKIIASKYVCYKTIILKSVKPCEVYHYLAACDEGIIFREPHIVNWVARPTKVLQYQAAKLKITHNNTIGMLVDLQQQTNNHSRENISKSSGNDGTYSQLT